MKIIKLDRRYHGHEHWSHALQFSKQEMHPRHRKHMPYVRAFREMFGQERHYGGSTLWDEFIRNPDWDYDIKHRRIYLNDLSVLTFIELKIA